jgi:hypothetical protein
MGKAEDIKDLLDQKKEDLIDDLEDGKDFVKEKGEVVGSWMERNGKKMAYIICGALAALMLGVILSHLNL